MADRNGYIGRAPSDSAVTVARQTFTPTGVTTDFTFESGYTPGYFDLFVNGVKMIEGSDFTSSDGSTFSVLGGGASSGDILEAVAYKAFNAVTGIIGVRSEGTVISSNANVINFVGTGNTFALRGDTVDISINAGAAGTWTNYDSNTGVSTTKKVKIENDLEVTGVTTSTGGFVGNVTGTATGLSGTPDITINNLTGVAGTFTGFVAFSTSISVGGTITYEDVQNVDSIGVVTARNGVKTNVSPAITIRDGTTEKGFIGFNGNDPFIGRKNGVGVAFQNNKIRPVDGDDGSASNNTVDIGENTYKFKDGYFAGTVNVADINATGIVTSNSLDAAISFWTLGASGTDHYTFTGPGDLSGDTDPDLQLIRGQKYVFKNRSGGHPFRIQSDPNGSSGTQYNDGVTNNDAGDGTDLIFDVPFDAPSILYYQCTSHGNMGGPIYIGSSSGDDVNVGTAISMYASSGIVSATAFYGDGANITGLAAGGSNVEVVTSNTTMEANKKYMLAASGMVVTLPASPSTGDAIDILNNVTGVHTVGRNGSTIQNLSEDMEVNTQGLQFKIWYTGSTWSLF